jgi:hypothetical protein
MEFLACQLHLGAYLVSIGITDIAAKPLPDDVKRRIDELRQRCKGPRSGDPIVPSGAAPFPPRNATGPDA